GVVHANWKPVPGRFKDYIALPKANGYQSLHTTVIGPYGERMEIQIRTRDMHRVAEYGVAAHWRYKQPGGAEGGDGQRFAWLRQMLEWQQQLPDPQEFLRSVKEDLFTEEVFAFTPQGDLLAFPLGSTVIDFAYRIHSEVGHHCAGARVNGRIRAWVKAQQSSRSVAVGREILERDLARHQLDLAKLRGEGTLRRVAEELGQKDEDTLLAAVGYGKVTAQQVLGKLLSPEELERRREKGEGRLQRLLRMVSRQTKSGVQVSGVEDMLVRFGKCCSPLPGERITGFITRGRGVTVHTLDCPKVLESDPQRRIDVQWEDGKGTPRPVRVEVTCIDQPGLLAAMSKAISSAGINITRAQVHALGDHKAQNV